MREDNIWAAVFVEDDLGVRNSLYGHCDRENSHPVLEQSSLSVSGKLHIILCPFFPCSCLAGSSQGSMVTNFPLTTCTGCSSLQGQFVLSNRTVCCSFEQQHKISEQFYTTMFIFFYVRILIKCVQQIIFLVFH